MKSIGFSLPERKLTYFRDLLRELVIRDMKLRYKRSILGIAWSLLNPLSQMVVFIIVFRYVLPLHIPNYPSFLFAGVLVWGWFASSLHWATTAVVDNRDLVRRPGFPLAVLPMVSVTSNLVHFLLALPVFVLCSLIGGGPLTTAIIALPFVIVIQFILTLGLAYMVATFHVAFRDTQYLLGIVLNLFFYLTPIFYDVKAIPAKYQPIYGLNPMVHLLEAYRALLINGTLPGNVQSLLEVCGISVGLLALGYWLFKRASYRFVDEL